MKVVVSEKSPIERELEVSVESAKLTQSWDKQLNQVKQQVSIPGFRRGKAPRHIVERHVNQEELRRTVFEEIGAPAYQEAIRQEKLAPLGEPAVQLVQFEPGKDLIFKAIIEIKPDIAIEATDYEGVEVEMPKLEITDEDVVHVLEDFQQKAARTVAVDENRGLADGDIAVVDFEATHEGAAVPNGSGENFEMKIDDKLFIPGFAANLHGMKVDEKREFDVEFPADYGNKDLAGKNVHFKFHLHTIKVREVPALDDDFAKEVSRFATLDAFKADIRERLENNLKLEAGQRVVYKLAGDKGDILVPKAFSNNVIMQTLENQARQLAQVGIKFEDFLRQQKIDPTQLINRMRPQAEVSARAEMLLDAIMRKEAIEISDAELEDEMRKFAESQGRDFDELQAEMKQHEHTEQFRADMARQRVLAHVGGKAKLVPEKAEAEPSAETESVPVEAEAAEAPAAE